jgi:alcohol dehydrogenase class IV
MPRDRGIRFHGHSPITDLFALQAILVAAINHLNKRAKLTYTLGQLGVDRGVIPELAERAMHDPCIFTNPRQPRSKDIEAIYE